MKFDAVHIHSTPEALVEQILAQIKSGHLRPGDCLPSQRELARMFGVGLGSVREALKVLHVMGCIHVQRGKGTYVAEDALAIRNETSTIDHALEAMSLAELMKARQVVESGAAGLAADKADAENIRQLRTITSRMRASSLYSPDYYDNDFQFHLAVADASQNRAIYEIVRLLVERTHHHINFMNQSLGISMPAAMGECVSSAGRVVDLIEAGNSVGAAEAMSAHLRTVNDRLADEFPVRRPKRGVVQTSPQQSAGTGSSSKTGRL